MIDLIRNTIEKSSFGVCTFLGDKFKISTEKVRLYFIYTSFVTIGSPIILYLVIAFWINIRKYIRKGYNLILD